MQNAEFQDAAGNRIRISVWEHPDLKPLEGKEVVLHSSRGGNNKFGGVVVRHNSYVTKKKVTIEGREYNPGDTVETIELSVSKIGQFQLIEVYKQQNPSAAVAEPSAPTVTTQPASKPSGANASLDPKAEGQRAGMCFKLAGDYRIATRHQDEGEDDFVAGVAALAKKLVQASRELEHHQ